MRTYTLLNDSITKTGRIIKKGNDDERNHPTSIISEPYGFAKVQ